VGKIAFAEAKRDDTLDSVQDETIPEGIYVFVEKTLGLPDPVILDFVEFSEDIFLAFIPLIPRPLETYEFVDPSNQSLHSPH
jgi:hypothetical protein